MRIIGLALFIAVEAHAQLPEHRSQAEVMQFLTDYQPVVVSATGSELSLDALGSELRDKRVVFVAEQHDRYDHHLNQLLVMRLMHQQNPALAIGVEWFQQPFQQVLDDYLAGHLSEAEMLRQSGYYERWRYDFRLLRPLLEYAREHQLPVIALNAPSEITRKVSAEGLAALSAAERAQIPATIHPPQDSYREYLQAVFAEHMAGQGDVERFVLVQRIWDETMAANIVKQLTAHPEQRMIVFAGSGHLAKGTAIPGDVARVLPAVKQATLHSVQSDDIQPDNFDYFFVGEALDLPPVGKLGVWPENGKDAEAGAYVAIRQLAPESAAGEAGLLVGDRLISIDGRAVSSVADLLMVLADTRRGQSISVKLRRMPEDKNPKTSHKFSYRVLLK